MLEVFSNDVAVETGASVPLNTETLVKGTTAIVSGGKVIEINKCGYYMISVDAVVTALTPGIVTLQMCKNGTPLPQAKSSATVEIPNHYVSLSFETLVDIPKDASCLYCDVPTLITFTNTGISALISINVIVTKLC